MRRGGLGLALVLTLGLVAMPGTAGAGDVQPAQTQGFIGHGQHFIGHEKLALPLLGHGQHFIGHEKFARPPQFNRGPAFVPPGQPVVEQPPLNVIFVVVSPVPAPVWVPGFWQWDGFGWVWIPDHWSW